MDIKYEMILDEYKSKIELYELLDKIVIEKLKDYVKELGIIVNSVESRIKTEKSLKGKLELKGSKYQSINDITDILGARIVTFYCDDVDKFAAKLENDFVIDWENSVDKRKMHNIDQFGYMSLHYICSVPKDMYENKDYPELNEIRFEIQLRSILQHTWASIHHDTGYKNDVEVPKEYLRALNRLAGLLELADDSFSQIRASLSDYRRRVKQVVKNGSFNEVELNGDSFDAYIENGGIDFLNKRIAAINNMEIEVVPLKNYLRVFKMFNFKTLKDLDDFVKNYSDMAYEFSVRQFSGKDLDIITSAAGLLALCIVYVLDKDMGVNIVKYVLDTLYGERKNNEKLAKKLTEIGKTMGLVKSGD